MSVEGHCDPAFAGVRQVLERHLVAGVDLGASVAVVVGGRPVVDLWGGVADARAGRAWERDTACITFSATKAVVAVGALLLAERGLVDLTAPVTSWWPEFVATGATGEHLLSHQAGLPFFDRPISVDEAADPAAMAAELARQAPQWVPGTAHGYHALTFGWLVGELVRRVAGEPVRAFVAREFGSDLRVGVAPERLGGLARLSPGRPGKPAQLPAPLGDVARLVDATADPGSAYSRSTGNPAASFNNPAVLTAGWPAAGLVTTARAFAGFYAHLIDGTLLHPDTLDNARRQRVRGPDRTLVLESAFGLGVMLPSANMFLPPAARASAFGHPGASGALALADPAAGVAFAYIPNLTKPGLGDRRAYTLVDAVYQAL